MRLLTSSRHRKETSVFVKRVVERAYKSTAERASSYIGFFFTDLSSLKRN